MLPGYKVHRTHIPMTPIRFHSLSANVSTLNPFTVSLMIEVNDLVLGSLCDPGQMSSIEVFEW
jgi:hypothetical protein